MRGAASFLRETISRVRYAGATGPLTMRADSGFYDHDIIAACRDKSVRFSTTVRQHQNLRNIIESHTRGGVDARPILDGERRRRGRDHVGPFAGEPYAAPVRLIVQRVKPTPDSQLAIFTTYSYHAFITNR